MHAGKVSSCAQGLSTVKDTDTLRKLLAHILGLNSVKRIRRNHCRLSNLASQYPFYIGVDDTITIPVYPIFYQNAIREKVARLRHAFIGCEKKKSKIFEACLFDRAEPRHQPDIHRW